MTHKLLVSAGVAAALIASVVVAQAKDPPGAKFIKEAIQGNLAEVEMGRLAQANAQSADVKSFGQMLQQDHAQNNQQATAVAQQMGVTPPTEPSKKQKADHAKMAKLTGDKFDKAFVRHMIADHKKEIAAFRKQAKKKDATADYASQTVPALEKHLETAQSLAKGAPRTQ